MSGRPRRGLTLVELLLAISVLGIIAVALSSLAVTVQTGHEHVTTQGEAAQHARVVLSRMERTAGEAHASEEFPGFAVFAETVDGRTYPDTLVVWHPTSSPAHPAGSPLFSELVVFCPDPASPWQLLEIRVPQDNRPTPPLSDTVTWYKELAALKRNERAERVTLTDLVRVGKAGSGSVSSVLRGAVFFHVRTRPSAAEWQQFRQGSVAWGNLAWAQSLHGSQTGLRQCWCAMEIHLVPGAVEQRLDPRGERTVPFFGSATIYYDLKR